MVRGIRGATTADANTPEAIWAATRELLAQMLAANGMAIEATLGAPSANHASAGAAIDSVVDAIAAVMFTTTPDLDAAFPAAAARQLGLIQTALFGAQDMMPPGSPARCIRVLILLNTTKSPADIRHVYLKEARTLRPDLVER